MTSPADSEPLSTALRLAAQGIPVFPCRPDKRPYTKHGFKDATADQNVIREWWRLHPDALIGLPTGQASGLVVLDVDRKPGRDGEATLSALVLNHGKLPDTYEARTPSGGQHIYFSRPADGLACSNDKLGAGLDIRADGGYVIYPPSQVNGAAYEWVKIPGCGCPPMPQWLLELVRQPKTNADQASPATSADGRTIPEGARNDTLFRLASALRAKGLTEPGILAALQAENRARCRPPLPDAEVGRIGHSAGRYEPGTATEWPEIIPLPERGDVGEAPPFPMDVLPAALRDACREVARFVRVPEGAPAIVGMASIATAIGKRALVVERQGLVHHPALFFVGIAASGERKSPVFRAMTEPVEEWVDTQKPAWEEAMRQAKARSVAIDAAIAKQKKPKDGGGNLEAVASEIARLEAERLPLPPHPRLHTTDSTEQRLFQLMHEREGAFAVLSGEGRPVFDAIMGKYSGDKRTGDALYLAGISGDTITRDRVGGENGPEERVIRRPCLNVSVMVQPDKYLEVAGHQSLRASGALARIWPVWLPPMAGTRLESEDEPGLNPFAMEGYRTLLRRILDHEGLPEWLYEPQPHKAKLSSEAARARRAFHNKVEKLMGEGGDYEDVKDIASKAVSQTAKLALVLHIAENPAVLDQLESEISGDTWTAAQALGEWFLNEAVRVQRMADEDIWLEHARRVLRWIQRERLESVTSMKLTQSGPRPRLRATDADKVLDMLADHGFLRADKPDGKKKPILCVNPALLSQISRSSQV